MKHFTLNPKRALTRLSARNARHIRQGIVRGRLVIAAWEQVFTQVTDDTPHVYYLTLAAHAKDFHKRVAESSRAEHPLTYKAFGRTAYPLSPRLDIEHEPETVEAAA